MIINDNIKILRQSKKITQEELAKMLGVKKQTVQKYENGVIENIPYKSIIAIAKIFSVSPAYLMGWEEAPARHAPTGVYLTDHERAVVEAYRARPDMNIYDRIKELRIAKGMSQEELAKRVGYKGRSAISHVESGIRDINQSMIIKYADALNVTPTYLLYGTDDANAASNSAPTGVYLTDHERAVVEAYRARPDMQAAVDVLLGVPADAADGVKRA